MPKRVAIVQSNYIPWKGYFDLINSVDEFVLYDDMQYTKSDWRNRNIIKTSCGLKWLTIPVKYKFLGDKTQKINQTQVDNAYWGRKHWGSICNNYVKAKYFHVYEKYFSEFYLDKFNKVELLSEVNYELIKGICQILNIKTRLSHSKDYHLCDERNQLLVELCKQLKADVYLSGPLAKDYMDEELFNQAGIQVEWMSYESYPQYKQLYGDFEHGVSVLDLIFNCGKDAHQYMKSFK